MKKTIHHGDTADTAKVKGIYHGGHGVHGERQRKIWFLSVISVSSVVNLGFRRVAVTAMVESS
jgi:hypothetical protein